MNNYCTNCGNRLKKRDLVCSECNTPIIDLPDDYEFKSVSEKSANKKTRNIVIFCSLFVLGLFLIYFVFVNVKSGVYLDKYVKPFLKENYGDLDYSIEYDGSGKCIVSGNCYFDLVRGCDGGACDEYEYLNEFGCFSYYYIVETADEKFVVTVVDYDKKVSVVKGRSIYGTEEGEEVEENVDDTSDDVLHANDGNNSLETDNHDAIIDESDYTYMNEN